MATVDNLKNQVAQQNTQAQTQTQAKGKTIDDLLKQMAPAMSEALPKHMSVDRLSRLAMTTIRTNPALKEADMGSLLGAVMQSAQLGLEPGLMGHCYLLPFKNKNKGITEVQFIIGYKGMIDLARRSGHIKSIYAHAVYSNDEFEYQLGLNADLIHKPAMENRGDFIGAYAVAHFKDGGYQFEFMSKSDIDKRKGRSKASKFGPWVTDYDEMAKKTVVRAMFKYLPISIEHQEQIAYDEGTAKDVSKMKDITPETELLDVPEFDFQTPNNVNTETGEIIE